MISNSDKVLLRNEVKKGFGNKRIILGAYWPYVLNNTPRYWFNYVKSDLCAHIAKADPIGFSL